MRVKSKDPKIVFPPRSRNPDHHNYGRSMPFITRLSSRLAWLSLTLKGNAANMRNSCKQLDLSLRDKEIEQYPAAMRNRLRELISDAEFLSAQCNNLVLEVNEFNTNKRLIK